MFRLLMEKNALNDELEKLMNRVKRYFKFHDFLRDVMAEGGGYDEPRQVMTRHATLTHLLVVSLCPSVSITLLQHDELCRHVTLTSPSGKTLSFRQHYLSST